MRLQRLGCYTKISIDSMETPYPPQFPGKQGWHAHYLNCVNGRAWAVSNPVPCIISMVWGTQMMDCCLGLGDSNDGLLPWSGGLKLWTVALVWGTQIMDCCLGLGDSNDGLLPWSGGLKLWTVFK